MRIITLERLTLRNFKKIKDLSIDFSNNTQINGDNGTGKTTVFDAYSWLLYGKNSFNQSDFSIKTLDENNNVIHKLEHEVEGEFHVDGLKIVFKRLYVEKWVTKRGEENEELTGHETKYFVDDVPMSKNDYALKVSTMIEENLSKMVSNPMYFNDSIKWGDRRAILEKMAGEFTDEDVLNFDGDRFGHIPELIALLNSGQSLEGERLKILASKKKLKEERDGIPARIDELDRMNGELPNFEQLETDLSGLTTERNKIDSQILDVNAGLDEQRAKITAAKDLKFEKEQAFKVLERTLLSVNDTLNETDTNLFHEAKENGNKCKVALSGIKSQISTLELEVEQLQKDKDALIVEWKAIKNEQAPTITESDTDCPTCKRELENAGQIKENLVANFNTSKTNRLRINNENGTRIAQSIKDKLQSIEELRTDCVPLEESMIKFETSINEVNIKIKAPKEAPQPTAEMIALQTEIDSIVVPELVAPDQSELTAEKTKLGERISEINKELGKKDQVEQSKKRTIELQDKQKELSQLIADLEKTEFQIDAFNKAKINLVESRINSKFSLVRFKMFDQQLNGGESPACECIVGGVPFKDLNTASQINAGLDIINGLQKHFEILAPVFIDHRESVFQLQPMDCQLVGLMADVTAKKLTVVNQ
jgi:DNA repair exonuclease SbcCD ATPase subunit